MNEKKITHPIDPIYHNDSKILILGSFPSVKSRENQFFYGHPQNRFWKVLATLLKEPLPKTIAEKKALLLRHGIAVWDVIQSCEVKGSSDSSIQNVTPNDLTPILETADIQEIYTNGAAAEKYYKKYLEKKIGRTCICLPSTSPANARFQMPELLQFWKVILNDTI